MTYLSLQIAKLSTRIYNLDIYISSAQPGCSDEYYLSVGAAAVQAGSFVGDGNDVRL